MKLQDAPAAPDSCSRMRSASSTALSANVCLLPQSYARIPAPRRGLGPAAAAAGEPARSLAGLAARCVSPRAGAAGRSPVAADAPGAAGSGFAISSRKTPLRVGRRVSSRKTPLFTQSQIRFTFRQAPCLRLIS